MAKSKAKNKASAARADVVKSTKPLTLTELRNSSDLWYKVRVLIYDLQNMKKDKTCENRTLQTTDPLYISAPYFSADEAAAVKNTVVDTSGGTTITLEEKMSSSLENFFEKRRASGDCRPCGPHDLVPVYLECFGMEKGDIVDEKFCQGSDGRVLGRRDDWGFMAG
ncbi:hypothetical protein MBLNU457_6027t1 [Dothideomycetes sp. NU457]